MVPRAIPARELELDGSATPPQGSGLTAVIIEDDTISRTLLRGILRNCRIAIVGETSLGRRALAPHIVCLDIGLPDADGTELLKELKLRCPTTNVIMVTGTAQGDRVRAALAGGALGYIVKPYTESTIRATLRRLFPDYELESSS